MSLTVITFLIILSSKERQLSTDRLSFIQKNYFDCFSVVCCYTFVFLCLQASAAGVVQTELRPGGDTPSSPVLRHAAQSGEGADHRLLRPGGNIHDPRGRGQERREGFSVCSIVRSHRLALTSLYMLMFVFNLFPCVSYVCNYVCFPLYVHSNTNQHVAEAVNESKYCST